MTADPAIAAAMRAMLTVESPTVRDTAIAAAREALAPLRKLHRKRRAGGETYCAECCHIIGDGYELTYQSWPCATAKLIYPEDELI
ncbi:hypothetical protein SEA_SPOOKY_78 [Gordonia phage Spooky]|nr:hypothetical protein SEA_SPOOKY_78 [Gordonia phage Spooky]